MPIQKKTIFETRIDNLHHSADRIAGGLKEVLDVLDGIARDNAAYLEAPGKGGKEQIYAGDIFDSVAFIRGQIEEITQISNEFADNINHHGNEIVELNKQLEETKKEAMLDPLTGVANRRKFEQVLGEFVKDIETMKGRLAVLMGDVDDFKRINDALGHHAGDQVLKLVARAFVYNLKNSDYVGRWGGDEFSAILPNTTPADAVKVSRRIRDMLAKKTIQDKSSGKSLGRVTLSIGVSSYNEGDSVEEITDRSDKAMYQAKNLGKNRVVSDEEVSSQPSESKEPTKHQE